MIYFMDNSFFFNIIYFDQTKSTNSELLNNDYEDRTIIYTYNQTDGRGRFDRNWITFKNKALALSILFKNTDKFQIKDHFIITKIISISLVETLQDKYNIKSRIKWPNDIYISDKKLAGILTETSFLAKDNFKIVSGIGINLNADSNDLSRLNKKATSINLELNKNVNIDEFTKSFIDRLSYNFSNFYEGKESKELIKSRWLNHCDIIGKTVSVKNFSCDSWDYDSLDSKLYILGKVVDIDNEGFLILKCKDKIEKIISGDLTILN